MRSDQIPQRYNSESLLRLFLMSRALCKGDSHKSKTDQPENCTAILGAEFESHIVLQRKHILAQWAISYSFQFFARSTARCQRPRRSARSSGVILGSKRVSFCRLARNSSGPAQKPVANPAR